jgi:hypothetical protein
LTAICGDFTDVEARRLPASDNVVRLYTLAGFTLGNYAETDLVTHIRSLMDKDDYLFLDARLHSFGDGAKELAESGERPASMVESYAVPSVRRFVFGPVEVATHATVDDVEIAFDITGDRTTIPNALSILIHCENLKTSMRLTGQPVHRDRLDLAITTRYDVSKLSPWFEDHGFSTVWRECAGQVAFLLLKRT